MSTNRPSPPPRHLLRVGRFFSVPIYFAPSWVIIAALLTISYAPVVAAQVPHVSASSAYLLAFAFAVLFALCVLAHELGHTAVSLLLGLRVRRVVIFLLGGVSEIEHDPQRPRDELLVSLAGPLVSVVITAACFGAYTVVDPRSMLGVMVLLLAWSNLIVAAFNLLPGLPLDGGRVFRAVVWGLSGSRLTGTRVGAWSGRVVAVLVAGSALILDRGTWGISAGIIGVALAAYLWFGAGQSLRAAQILDRLPSVSLQRLLRPGLLVPWDLSVAEALRRAWSGNARGLVVVDAADAPRAIVDEAQISAVPLDRRPWTSLSTVSRPLEPGLILPVGLQGEALLDAVRATPAHEYLVVNADGSPAGILATADLAAALQRPATA
ncbi:MAG: site-2 protease family protein [Jatrophihabitans sp.]|nr:MAG: site-2 protease family protein [Jatrophihabitans sp.]